MGEILLEIRWTDGRVDYCRHRRERDARRQIRGLAGNEDVAEVIVYEPREHVFPAALSAGLRYVED